MYMMLPMGDSITNAEEIKIPAVQQVNWQVVELEKRLLSLRFAVGTLKKNLQDAFAPLAAVLLPVVSQAVYGLARAVKSVGQVIGGLFGVRVAQDKVTKSIKKTTAATSAWLKRSLAAFDQLNRLQGKSGGGSGTSLESEEPLRLFPEGMTQEAQTLLAAINALLEPFKTIDLEPARWAFQRLRDSLRELSQAAGEAFGQLWHALLVPFVAWLAESFGPALVLALSAAMDLAAELTSIFGGAMVGLLEAMAPVTDFLGQVLVGVINQVRKLFTAAAESIQDDGSQIRAVFAALSQMLEAFWAFCGPLLMQIQDLFSAAFEQIGNMALQSMEHALLAVTNLLYALTALLDGDWEAFWMGMENMTRHAINALICLLNALLVAIAATFNAMFVALNKVSIDVPKWVPVYGGKKFQFDLKPMTAPKIPLLAKGAVLPANKPFLAVVGDQKHGTNIEAPLATIQEAVAITMEDLAAQNAAGQEATVAVLSQILQAVLGISIGDDRLAAAVDRCHAKTAVMRGGV